VGCCEHRNEPLGSIKYRESDQLSGCRLLKKISVELIKLFSDNGEGFSLLINVKFKLADTDVEQTHHIPLFLQVFSSRYQPYAVQTRFH
jgi:hypothetical protein